MSDLAEAMCFQNKLSAPGDSFHVEEKMFLLVYVNFAELTKRRREE